MPQKVHFSSSSGQHAASAVLLLILVALFVCSLFIGRYSASGHSLISWDLHDPMTQTVMFHLRLPRAIAAVFLGMSLAASGMVFQMIFSNPLVEPGFLGVSQGAAFGAALCIVYLGNSAILVQVMAITFAFIGLAASWFLANRIRYGGHILRLVLSGIAVSAMFSAGLGILKYLADPLSQLQEITFWLLGGLWGITWESVLPISPVVLLSLSILYKMRWRLNLLSLGDTAATSLGVHVSQERGIVLLAAVSATAAVISVAGLVGWIGLIVPHLARRIFGSDARRSFTTAMLMGGIFVLACDDLGRTLLAGEIPLGILSSLIGASSFLVLMLTQKVGNVA
ncbi:MAG: iron ABC transporter permease [Candidatus Ozemobacteraceae bacterium]